VKFLLPFAAFIALACCFASAESETDIQRSIAADR